MYLISINQLLLSFYLTMSCLLAKFFSMLLSATWFTTRRWFSSGTHISSTNKTDRHDMTVILMKITLNTINLNLNLLTLWFLSLLVASKISFKEIIWSSTVQYFILFSIPFNLFHISDYQGGNQNPYIEDNRQHNGQTKKYKRTNNDLQNIHIKLTQVLRKGKQFIIH
jgi:hypothetical protein